MEIILKELHSRGHDLTVMNSAKSWYIPEKSPMYTVIPMKSLQDYIEQNHYEEMLKRHLDFRKKWPFFNSIYQQWDLTDLLANGNVHLANAAMSLFKDKAYMAQLKDAKYDMLLTDPAFPIGVLLGRYLDIPMVFNVCWINNGDSHFTFAPSPVSYIPLSGSNLPDQMTFSERIINMLFFFTSLIQQHLFIDPPYRELLDLYFPPGSTMLGLQQAAHLWLVRSDFVLESPRPTMPNVVYVGGFQCKPAKLLPPDMEEFMQSSGEHGVVIMSLGTIISALPKEITEIIAAAFAELPQKVIWKYLGEAPSAVGNNILLVNWFPQNDLLGHPKTRAFVLRHKGAPHLRTEAYTMPWYAYYSVDVAVLLLSIVAAILWILVCVLKLLYHKIFNRKRKQE